MIAVMAMAASALPWPADETPVFVDGGAATPDVAGDDKSVDLRHHRYHGHHYYPSKLFLDSYKVMLM